MKIALVWERLHLFRLVIKCPKCGGSIGVGPNFGQNREQVVPCSSCEEVLEVCNMDQNKYLLGGVGDAFK